MADVYWKVGKDQDSTRGGGGSGEEGLRLRLGRRVSGRGDAAERDAALAAGDGGGGGAV